VLGFETTYRFGREAAFVSTGGYHHHIGLNTWESLGENIGSPTKQGFADNLRHLPLPPVTPSTEVELSAYPGEGLNFTSRELWPILTGILDVLLLQAVRR
jgi:hypothetical protein